MSPYITSPPPMYARNWANGHNLVESTKIERHQVVPFKKVHRKEKKEKKKSKKEKKVKPIEKLYFPINKRAPDESEQLEKSCLTEEIGYLSDGSQNSKKRRREASPPVESSIKATPVAGNPLRIRFVFKKPKEAEAFPQEDRVCSSSGTERPVEVSSSISCLKTVPDDVDNLLSTSIESDKIAPPCEESKSGKKHKRSKESRYNALFDDWVPPCLSLTEDNSNSDDWLFRTSRKEKAIKKEDSMIIDSKVAGDPSFPRAQFLPEVGIFSLPYTVLF